MNIDDIDPTTPLLAVLPPVAELVPHRPPMLLLERVLAADYQSIVCETTIRDGGAFVRDGQAAATVAIEYMAQAAAAWLGALARTRIGVAGGGWLVGLRNVVLLTDAFATGDVLEVHALHTWGRERFMSFECKVKVGGRDAASATLNVLRSEA